MKIYTSYYGTNLSSTGRGGTSVKGFASWPRDSGFESRMYLDRVKPIYVKLEFMFLFDIPYV